MKICSQHSRNSCSNWSSQPNKWKPHEYILDSARTKSICQEKRKKKTIIHIWTCIDNTKIVEAKYTWKVKFVYFFF